MSPDAGGIGALDLGRVQALHPRPVLTRAGDAHTTLFLRRVDSPDRRKDKSLLPPFSFKKS